MKASKKMQVLKNDLKEKRKVASCRCYKRDFKPKERKAVASRRKNPGCLREPETFGQLRMMKEKRNYFD